MDISNSFSEHEIPQIAGKIFSHIHSEPHLTNRSMSYIYKLLRSKAFFIMMDKKKQVKGFIAKERLSGNYYELKCWYIVPSERNRGLSKKIFDAATQDKRHTYLLATFQKEIAETLKMDGFQPISFINLPANVLLRYLITRHWSSILRHLFIRKSYLIIKSQE